MVASDATPGSRQLLNVLIKGTGSVTGLQLRLDNQFGPSLPRIPKAQSRYTYDPTRQGMYIIAVPLERPLVTFSALNRQRTRFYKNDRLPTDGSILAWVWTYRMQVDVWARSPVETAAISDFLAAAFVAMAIPMWDNHRIGLDVDSFEVVEFEVEQGIYREMALSTVTTAATAVADP